MNENMQNTLAHFQELAWRMRIAAIAYVLGVLILMNFSDLVFAYLTTPLRALLPKGAGLVFLNAPDVFFTYLKIALLLSLFATSPILLYQVWAFIAPAMYQHERKAFIAYVLASTLLLLAGAAFAFYLVFPIMFQFFLGFANEQIMPMLAIKEYLGLALKLMFAFGLSFQIPILIMLLSRLNIIDAKTMAEKRRYVIVWMFIFAAILTPPDVISQLMLAVPMMLLFELGIVLAKKTEPKHEALAPNE